MMVQRKREKLIAVALLLGALATASASAVAGDWMTVDTFAAIKAPALLHGRLATAGAEETPAENSSPASDAKRECHVTIKVQTGERVTVCDTTDENGRHGEEVGVSAPTSRWEQAFRIDTSKGTLGGPNGLIPHAVDQINEGVNNVKKLFGG